MHALVRAAAAAGLLSLLGAWGRAPTTAAQDRAPLTSTPGGAAHPASSGNGPAPAPPSNPGQLRCPAGQLPDVDPAAGRAACIPLPPYGTALASARSRRLALRSDAALHLRADARDQGIPRLPGRPEAYTAYVLPAAPVGPVLPARPDPELVGIDALGQPWEPAPLDVPWGIRIETADEAPVTVAQLDHEQGKPTVRLVGDLYGITVVTEHGVETAGGTRQYLVFYGHLARPGPHVVTGATLEQGSVVGFAGTLDGADAPHVYLEVRQLRAGAEPQTQLLSDLVRPSVSVPCDPRNVLGFR